MCGIVGYIGKNDSLNILLNGLSKLEYRGYDSAGIAVIMEKDIKIEKSKGKLANLKEKLVNNHIKSNIGIGHTRWATHGAPSDINAHPHFSHNNKLAIIHNGIIENYLVLKKELQEKGYEFISETDSEIIANLLHYYDNKNFLISIKKTIKRIEGSYALGIIHKDYPNTLFAVKNESPLIIGIADNEYFIASDVPAILEYTNNIYYLENKEIATLNNETGVTFYNGDLKPIQKNISKITWSTEAAEKQGYKHFMLKEIFEQPNAISNTINPRIKNNLPTLDIKITKEQLKKINKVYVVACGTSYYAGLNAKPLIEQLVGINTEIDIASEFRYRSPLVDEKSLVIIISQSGETADTLAALRLAKEKGARVISIVNVVGSSIARESDEVIYTWAGPEIAVASTKAFTTQLSIIYLLTIKLGLISKKISKLEAIDLITELKRLPHKVSQILEKASHIKGIAKLFYKDNDAYFIGRGMDYYTALEGALKLKEISYIHAECYAAGELKHGTIALIEDNTLVVAICTVDELLPKMISNIKEVESRGAKTLVITNQDEEIGDYNIFIPKTDPYFLSILSVIPLQLFAYYTADLKKCDVDKPKNLAKSVTVE
jgi:glutamine---fructose-6-phosphate transaminase (isomerizing)